MYLNILGYCRDKVKSMPTMQSIVYLAVTWFHWYSKEHFLLWEQNVLDIFFFPY